MKLKTAVDKVCIGHSASKLPCVRKAFKALLNSVNTGIFSANDKHKKSRWLFHWKNNRDHCS